MHSLSGCGTIPRLGQVVLRNPTSTRYDNFLETTVRTNAVKAAGRQLFQRRSLIVFRSTLRSSGFSRQPWHRHIEPCSVSHKGETSGEDEYVKAAEDQLQQLFEQPGWDDQVTFHYQS